MSVRRQTDTRLFLIRTCHTCGKIFSTTAASPFMRQIKNVGGKKQKTCYFCSETCKAASYKHLFDGKAAERKAEYAATGIGGRAQDATTPPTQSGSGNGQRQGTGLTRMRPEPQNRRHAQIFWRGARRALQGLLSLYLWTVPGQKLS